MWTSLLRQVLHRNESRTIIGVEQPATIVTESGVGCRRGGRHGQRYRVALLMLMWSVTSLPRMPVSGRVACSRQLEPAMVGRGRALHTEAEAVP